MTHKTALAIVSILVPTLVLTGLNAQTSRRRRPAPPRTRPPAKQSQKKPRQTAFGDKNSVEFTLVYDFQIQAVPSELKFIAPIPRTIPDRQEIFDVRYSHEPARVFDKDGTKYAEFVFRKPPNELRLEMNITATLFRFDLATAKKRQSQPVENLADPNVFLMSEKYIEQDSPRIQQIAKTITAPNQIAVVGAIYEYVTDNISYLIQKQELGALQTLEKRQGACTEYSDLFVALCRAKGIPARVVKGYVSEPVYLPQHAWAEAYLNEYGWVPFDPTYGDVPDETTKNRNFENLKPIYVYLSHVRNDPILDAAITISGFSVGDVAVEHTAEFK
jgi:transglutaminase-like putative cysteine protease